MKFVLSCLTFLMCAVAWCQSPTILVSGEQQVLVSPSELFFEGYVVQLAASGDGKSVCLTAIKGGLDWSKLPTQNAVQYDTYIIDVKTKQKIAVLEGTLGGPFLMAYPTATGFVQQEQSPNDSRYRFVSSSGEVSPWIPFAGSGRVIHSVGSEFWALHQDQTQLSIFFNGERVRSITFKEFVLGVWGSKLLYQKQPPENHPSTSGVDLVTNESLSESEITNIRAIQSRYENDLISRSYPWIQLSYKPTNQSDFVYAVTSEDPNGKEAPKMLEYDVTSFTKLPESDAFLYGKGGVVLMRKFVVVPEAFKQARLAAAKTKQMSDAKQVATALMIFAADNKGKLPTKDDFRNAVLPYIKNHDMMKEFVFTLGGANLDKIAKPAETEMGYIQRLDGRIVAYADGHVKFVPNQPPK